MRKRPAVCGPFRGARIGHPIKSFFLTQIRVPAGAHQEEDLVFAGLLAEFDRFLRGSDGLAVNGDDVAGSQPGGMSGGIGMDLDRNDASDVIRDSMAVALLLLRSSTSTPSGRSDPLCWSLRLARVS